jgi:NADPH2:quinone reductase
MALVGITAHLGLFRCARLEAGETVFVNGGTGGVGSAVVQLAKAAGAKVITTAGSAEKKQLAESLGADIVLNYKTDDIASAIRDFTGGGGAHVWYETLREPDFERTVPLLARRGRMIVMAGREAKPVFPVGPFYVKDLSLHGFAMFNASPEEQRQCAADLNRWMAGGKLRPLIGRTFPLSQTAAAHRLQQENTIGKKGTLTGKIVIVPAG